MENNQTQSKPADAERPSHEGLSSSALLAIRLEGCRTRLEVAFWANFAVFVCFHSESEITRWIIMGASASCMIAFYMINKKWKRLSEEIDALANTSEQVGR